jgi:hypothetical protein
MDTLQTLLVALTLTILFVAASYSIWCRAHGRDDSPSTLRSRPESDIYPTDAQCARWNERSDIVHERQTDPHIQHFHSPKSEPPGAA